MATHTGYMSLSKLEITNKIETSTYASYVSYTATTWLPDPY